MAYRQPSFMVDNPMSRVSDYTADIWMAPNTTGLTDADRRALIDFRLGAVATFTATSTGAGVRWDLGAIPAADFDTMIVGPNHNLQNGDQLRAFTDDNSALSTATQLHATTHGGGSAVIEMAINAGSERYWAWQINNSGSQDFELTELWLGNKDTLSADAFVSPRFQSGWANEVRETAYPGGTAALEQASPRRTFSLDLVNITAGAADDTLLLEVIQNGRARPFWYWPPDDDDPGPFLVRLDEDAQRVQEYAAPSVSIRYRYSLRMTEQAF